MSARTTVRVATAATAATALLLSASPAGAATTSERFSTRGVTASAFTTTAPADGDLRPGVTYTDTFLDAGQQATRTSGQRLTSSFAFVSSFSYRIDRKGVLQEVDSFFGFAGPEDVTFTGDTKLRGASVSGSIPTVSCDQDVCTDGTPIAVDATWTGTGAVSKVSSRFSSKDGQTAFSFSFRGTQREATVTGSIDGLDLRTATFASLSNGTSTDKFVCHAC